VLLELFAESQVSFDTLEVVFEGKTVPSIAFFRITWERLNPPTCALFLAQQDSKGSPEYWQQMKRFVLGTVYEF
jgi:hypothetical protein